MDWTLVKKWGLGTSDEMGDWTLVIIERCSNLYLIILGILHMCELDVE